MSIIRYSGTRLHFEIKIVNCFYAQHRLTLNNADVVFDVRMFFFRSEISLHNSNRRPSESLGTSAATENDNDIIYPRFVVECRVECVLCIGRTITITQYDFLGNSITRCTARSVNIACYTIIRSLLHTPQWRYNAMIVSALRYCVTTAATG